MRFTLLLADTLRARGVLVGLARLDSVDAPRDLRVARARSFQPDLVLAFHLDNGGTAAGRVGTIIADTTAVHVGELATALSDTLSKALGGPLHLLNASLLAIRSYDTPGVVLKLGDLDNKASIQRLHGEAGGAIAGIVASVVIRWVELNR